MTIPLTNRGNKVKQHGTKGQISRRFKKCGGHSEEGKSSEPRTPERWGAGGGGAEDSGSGDTCTPMAESCQCMAKTTTIL